jgi:hypothetical protein
MPPDSPASELSTLQRWFQSVISHPEGIQAGLDTHEAQTLIALKKSELEKVIRRSKNLSAEQRLAIYASAYYARLLECLRESFPVLTKTLSPEVFNDFAFDYLQSHPSKTYTLNRLGDHFATFLDQTRPDRTKENPNPATDWPDFLIDLARLEWNIEQVFDGPGVEHQPILLTENLRNLSPEDFATARLIPNRSLKILEFKFPINAYYTATKGLKETDQPPPPPTPAPQFLALHRRDFIVRRTELSPPQHALLNSLQTGDTITKSIAAAARQTNLPQEQFQSALTQWFTNWTSSGFFERVANS